MERNNDEISEKPKRIKHTPQECDRGQKCEFLNEDGCPDRCPLDAEARESANIGLSEIKRNQETCDKCSTCRHTYEPKPRTIKLDAELPEPSDVIKDGIDVTIELNGLTDARAWYDAIITAMEKEQVEK